MIYRIPMNARGSSFRFKLHFFMLLLRNKDYFVEINDEVVEQLIDGYSQNRAAIAEANKKVAEQNAAAAASNMSPMNDNPPNAPLSPTIIDQPPQS